MGSMVDPARMLFRGQHAKRICEGKRAKRIRDIGLTMVETLDANDEIVDRLTIDACSTDLAFIEMTNHGLW
jgi:hypothetical protein